MTCVHLGSPRGYDVKCACRSTEGYEFVDAAHNCRLLKVRCLPTFPGPIHPERASDLAGFTLCHGCPHRAV